MKKIFGFRSKKGKSPSGSSINPVRDSSHGINLQPGYRIRDKDLRKIHKAAIVGNVAKVQHVLLFGKNGLNDRDKTNRTALHLACANGHSAVVTLLLERKCQLNLCDNENRTALMKAVECQEEECATLLLERGADPNVMDVCGNTALHYAVFCQNISLAAKLLSCDANIEARNKDNLTPLLLAIIERRAQMVEFLVKNGANIHAVDKLKRTALMLAVNYGSTNVVGLLLQQGVDIFSQDVFGQTAEDYAIISGFNIIRQLISAYKEERPKTPPENSNPVDESSEEDRLCRFSSKPGDDLWLTSNDEVLDFETKQSISESLPEKSVDCLSGAAGPRGKKTLNGQVEDSPGKYPNVKPAVLVKDSVPSKTVGMKDLQTSSSDLASTALSLSLETCQRAGRLKVGDQCPSMSQSMTKNQSASTELGQMTVTDEVKRNIAVMFLVGNSTLHDPCQSQLPENRESQQDLSAELDLEMISEEAQEKPDGDENNHSQVQEKKHKSSEVEVSDNECDAAAESGLIQQRKSGRNSSQEFPAAENEDFDSLRTSFSISHEAGLVVMNSLSSYPGVHRKEVKKKNNAKRTPEGCVIAPIFEKPDSLTGGLLHVNDENKVNQDDDRPARKTPYDKKKVREQINYVNHLDDLTQSSETVSEDDDVRYSTNSMLQVEPLGLGHKDSVSLLKIQDTILSRERLVGFQRSHCELLREFYRMKSKVRGLQKELSETKEVKSQLEHQKVEWERELGSLRFTLKQKEENRRNADMLCEKMREHLRRKEDEYSKEVEVKQQLELTFRAVEVKLKAERNNLNQVSDSCEKAKDLLRKNHMLQEEIAMLRLERDALKNQHREKEENYFEDIEILKVKNDDLQKTIKLDEEMLTKTISHYTGQLNALTAENAMLNSKLEKEKESKQRLETEVESYRSRLAAALHDHDQSQTSKRDLELAFGRARDEWLCLQDKMKSDVANLKDNNEMLSQQLSTVESKFNKLKIKLHHTRDDLREKTLMLEHVQRDLHQAEGQKQEIEHVYRNQQGKVNTYLGKQESLEERLYQLQSENMLLRQQLNDAGNRADSREKMIISIQDQFQQIVRKLQAEREKQGLMLEERNKELVKECNHLKERMCQYENEKAEGEAVVRQLQQELDDAVKKQSVSEASLRLTSRYCPKLEAEAQDLKNNCKLLQPRQVTSQTQAGFQQMEVRIKDLESELSKMKSLQEDSNKAELEKYKQLYLVECELIKLLEDKLDKTHQRLAVVSAKLQVEKQQNRSFFNTVSMRPVLEPPCVGNFNNPLVLNGNLTPRANLRFSTSIPRPSNNSMETYLTKMRRELDRSIARALREVDPQFASDAFRVSSRGSTDGSNVCDDLLL
ncbi:ankyrin repeat domain-containing protein 26-like isoform X5 [Bos indicus x Bos taurus]|uniref:ankyrin repeat domain-containing protein 26-like isoform X5 n=1 Tax=Bos indicus x Bos taurus TaxID=30522 RepID=UPI000F7D3669|nr:ankyrin repeat domain-containing protein 26-like isoform X5 [Bos indicus x Bos taurus]